MESNIQTWEKDRQYTPEKMALARLILEEIRSGAVVQDAVKRHPLPEGGYVGKHLLVAVYKELTKSGIWDKDPQLLASIRLKPTRTISGVTTVTVLTKPYPCPGKCIFCPTDIRMPKSYLPDEPGAMRALQHKFDPFNQVKARIKALDSVGHPTDKIELLILGGTWSSYKRSYQEWFVQHCLDAMNDYRSENLLEAQVRNETSQHRNVGMAIETRPDHIDKNEIKWLRNLGVTKIQIGAQSFNDHILVLNKRGHDSSETLRASSLLRAAGFKIVMHWMPNLLGATIDSDRIDFQRMWNGYCPDEIKIYPTQLLQNAELYHSWVEGNYIPYSTNQLVELIADIKETIPRYCRVNRVVRDIPSTHVVEGNKRTSLRQDVQKAMRESGKSCQCVRCREVRNQKIDHSELTLEEMIYEADMAEEHFISYVTPDDKLAGFLRLSLPDKNAPRTGIKEIDGVAIIREVHVYGLSLPLGNNEIGAAQHIGLGSQLIKKAEVVAKNGGFQRLAVISAIGTRGYYSRRGFKKGLYYLTKTLV